MKHFKIKGVEVEEKVNLGNFNMETIKLVTTIDDEMQQNEEYIKAVINKLRSIIIVK